MTHELLQKMEKETLPTVFYYQYITNLKNKQTKNRYFRKKILD